MTLNSIPKFFVLFSIFETIFITFDCLLTIDEKNHNNFS